MKRLFTYQAAILLTVTYMLSYIGFGIHTCSCDGTIQVILLFDNLSCETIHAHIHLKGSHEHHHGDGCCDEESETRDSGEGCTHNHEDGCCRTDIMVLTDDQDDSRQTNLVQVSFRTICSSGYLAANAPALPSGLHIIHNHLREAELPDIGGPTLPELSVRRI